MPESYDSHFGHLTLRLKTDRVLDVPRLSQTRSNRHSQHVILDVSFFIILVARVSVFHLLFQLFSLNTGLVAQHMWLIGCPSTLLISLTYENVKELSRKFPTSARNLMNLKHLQVRLLHILIFSVSVPTSMSFTSENHCRNTLLTHRSSSHRTRTFNHEKLMRGRQVTLCN